jgi:hypothetical protein
MQNVQATEEVFSLQNRTSSTLQIRIGRIRIRQNDADPTRSRSKTLLSTFQYSNIRKPRLSGSGFEFSHAADPDPFTQVINVTNKRYLTTVSSDVQGWSE